MLCLFGMAATTTATYIAVRWHLRPLYRRYIRGLYKRRLLKTFDGLTSQKKRALEQLLDRWVNLKAVEHQFKNTHPNEYLLERRISKLANEMLVEDVDEAMELAKQAQKDLNEELQSDELAGALEVWVEESPDPNKSCSKCGKSMCPDCYRSYSGKRKFQKQHVTFDS